MQQEIENTYQEYMNLMSICKTEMFSVIEPDLQDSVVSLLRTMERGVESLHDIFVHSSESRTRLKSVMDPIFEDPLFKEMNSDLEDLMSKHTQDTKSKHLEYLKKKIDDLTKFREHGFDPKIFKD